MELGAAWAFKRRAIPLLGPGATFGDLPGPFKGVVHALKMNYEADMSGLIKTVAWEAEWVVESLKALTAALVTAPAREATAQPSPDRRPTQTPPTSMAEDEAEAHLEAWLARLVVEVEDSGGPTPRILTPTEIATGAGVPESKASLAVRVAANNAQFGVTAQMLTSGSSVSTSGHAG